MKVVYTKESVFKLFGISIANLLVKYSERSRDIDASDDEWYIELNERNLRNK